jgi:hypothetical protein
MDVLTSRWALAGIAALAVPQVRDAVRKGVVYALAGAIRVSEEAMSAVRDTGVSAQRVAHGEAAEERPVRPARAAKSAEASA